MKNLRDIAKEQTTISELMVGRDKLDTENVIERELSISAVDIVTDSKGNTYSVMVFKEEPSAFYCGGLVLTDIIKAWVCEFGDLDAVNTSLQSEPVMIYLTEEKSKTSGMTYTKVEIL